MALTRTPMAKAINTGLRRAMEADPKVILMGEDIGALGDPLLGRLLLYDALGPRCPTTATRGRVGAALGHAGGAVGRAGVEGGVPVPLSRTARPLACAVELTGAHEEKPGEHGGHARGACRADVTSGTLSHRVDDPL